MVAYLRLNGRILGNGPSAATPPVTENRYRLNWSMQQPAEVCSKP